MKKKKHALLKALNRSRNPRALPSRVPSRATDNAVRDVAGGRSILADDVLAIARAEVLRDVGPDDLSHDVLDWIQKTLEAISGHRFDGTMCELLPVLTKFLSWTDDEYILVAGLISPSVRRAAAKRKVLLEQILRSAQ
jgi:hypothetical protein